MAATFVYYPRGAGGEYFAAAISQHNNFYKGNYSVKSSCRVMFNDNVISFFDYHTSQKKYIDPVECFDFLKPYIEADLHYVFPVPNSDNNKRVLDFIKEHSESKVISIHSHEYQKLINLEAVRKIYLTSETLDTFSIKSAAERLKLSPSIVKALFKKEMLFVDLILLENRLELNNSNRISYIENYLNQYQSSPYHNTDFLVKWEDFYYNLSSISDVYDQLSTVIGFEKDESILNLIVERNTKNKIGLDNFDYVTTINNFYNDNFSC